MSILTRAKQLIFGDSGGTGEFGQIGSKAAGSPATTKNLVTMQSLTEYLQGLNAIVSDQGTSVLPYLEDMNSLFFLTTSQLAYLFQAGVPKWEIGTDYYEFVSIVEDEGMLWLSINGVDPTPNTGNKPSTNQDKWIPISMGIKTSSISATGSFTTEYREHRIISDTSGGSNTITLNDGLFNGQKVTTVCDGTGLTYVKGTGLYLGASSLGIPVSDGLKLTVTWDDNLNVWVPDNEVTADYVSGLQTIYQKADGNIEIITANLLCTHIVSGTLQGVSTHTVALSSAVSAIEGGFILVSGIPTVSWAGSNSVINTFNTTIASVVVYIGAGSTAGNAASCNLSVKGKY